MCSFISKSLRAPFSVCSKLISVSQFIVLSISSPEISKIKNSIFLPFYAVQEIIFEDMKDILEKEIQISDLYPPTNVVRTDFTVVLTRFTTRSDSRSKFKMDPTSFDYSQFI